VPISPAPQPCWNTATIAPYAAPAESRLSVIVVAAITIERNAVSIRMNVITRTNTKTGTMPCRVLVPPRGPLLTFTAQVEQAVVDAHRQAHQQHHGAGRIVHMHRVADQCQQPVGR